MGPIRARFKYHEYGLSIRVDALRKKVQGIRLPASPYVERLRTLLPILVINVPNGIGPSWSSNIGIEYARPLDAVFCDSIDFDELISVYRYCCFCPYS